MSKLEQRVAQVIASCFGVELDKITPSTHLLELSDQPIRLNSFAAALEQEFEIEIDEEEIARAETVQDVINLVMFSW